MKIIVADTLRNQPLEFVEMVTNVTIGDIFRYDLCTNARLFLVCTLEDITTRFGSRDRILRGWKGKYEKGNFVGIERTSLWCSQLSNTEIVNYPKEIIIPNKEKELLKMF